MKLLKGLGFLVLASNLLSGQASARTADSDSKSSASDGSTVADDIKKLREALAEQQKQIAQQQLEIEALRRQVSEKRDASAKTDEQQPRMIDAAMHTSADPARATETPAYGTRGQSAEKPKDSPLSVRIGGAEFTPGGFIDFTTVFRSTNLGSGIATSFGSLPYNNVIQAHLTETRFTAQNSRVTLKATEKFGENDVTGYLEADFVGNDAANVFVTANSHTPRMRQFWLDVRRGKFEVLGGQAWGWLTPNRRGMGSIPADVFTTYSVDPNNHVGLPWTRAGLVRFIYHPNDHWGLGVSLENPQQFVGAGEVIFPFAFNAALGAQFDAANNSGAPNTHPDIIPKIAYDTDINGKHFHAEAAGLVTTVKATIVPIVAGGNGLFVAHSKTGGGGAAAVNLEIVKNFRVMANAFYSDGGGRYLIGLGPDTVIRPFTTAVGFDITPSLVHSGSGVAGFEAQVTPNTLFAAYYGGAYFQRNAFPDVTSPLVVKPFIGFGGVNSPNSANRAIQEGTFDMTQTFWKNPQYGALQLLVQVSYLTRAPWFVPKDVLGNLQAPKNAHLTGAYVNLRYVLP